MDITSQTLMKNKIIFLSHTPPLKTKGSGLSVLLYHIIFSLQNFNKEIITYCGEVKVANKEIKKDNNALKVLVCDAWFSKFYQIKGSRFFRDFLMRLSFIISLPRIGKQINNANTLVTVVIGTSAKPLLDFLILNFFFKKAKYGLYIVDDLELINSKLNNKFESFLTKKLLPASIKKSDYLITISNGLKSTYLTKYGKSSYVLLPHFSACTSLIRTRIDKTFTFLFTGGLNFLYNKSLLQIASIIDEINKTNRFVFILKLKVQTYSPELEFKKLDFKSLNVIYSTVTNRNELLCIYNECQCFVVPYSFDLEDKQIVESSFPQKVAEIIQYGKPSLVFGPDYSSVVQFFNNNNLNYVCSTLTKNKLRDTIYKIIEDYNTFNELPYLKAYDKFLSTTMINNLFERIYNNLN